MRFILIGVLVLAVLVPAMVAAQSVATDSAGFILPQPQEPFGSASFRPSIGLERLGSLLGGRHLQSLDPLRFYVGFLIPNRADGQFHEIQAIGAPNFSLAGVRHQYPQRGIWTGISQKISYSDSLDLYLEGWYLLPIKSSGISKYSFSFNGTGHYARNWDSDATGGQFDMGVYWSWDPSWRLGPWTQIHGVRYDYYYRKLDNPDDFEGGPVPWPSTKSDKAELKSSALIPYIGIQFSNTNAYGTAFGRVLVSPLVIGRLSHKEQWHGGGGRTDTMSLAFDQSYFTEIQTEFSRFITKDIELGGFLRLGNLGTYGEAELESTLGSGASRTSSYTMNFRKLMYRFGIRFTASFTLPY